MICDLAEIYHIHNYRSFTPSYIATLVSGFDQRSRVLRKATNTTITVEQMLLASCSDSLSFLAWAKTKDAEHNRNRPKPMLPILLGKDEKKEELMAFDSGEDFLKAWNG